MFGTDCTLICHIFIGSRTDLLKLNVPILLHNEELNDLHSSPSIVLGDKIEKKLDGQMGVKRGVYRVLEGKPEGKRPLGRHRRRWEDNIKMDFQEMGCGGMDWIELAQDTDRWPALGNEFMNLRVP